MNPCILATLFQFLERVHLKLGELVETTKQLKRTSYDFFSVDFLPLDYLHGTCIVLNKILCNCIVLLIVLVNTDATVNVAVTKTRNAFYHDFVSDSVPISVWDSEVQQTGGMCVVPIRKAGSFILGFTSSAQRDLCSK